MNLKVTFVNQNGMQETVEVVAPLGWDEEHVEQFVVDSVAILRGGTVIAITSATEPESQPATAAAVASLVEDGPDLGGGLNTPSGRDPMEDPADVFAAQGHGAPMSPDEAFASYLKGVADGRAEAGVLIREEIDWIEDVLGATAPTQFLRDRIERALPKQGG